MRWVGAAEILQRLGPLEAVAAVERVLHQHLAGTATADPRTIHGRPELPLALMPGSLPESVGLKAITVVEGNPARGLPTVQGVVLLFDGHDGRLLGAVDGPALTAVRTGAIAGYATSVLAREEATTMLLAGAGAQAPFQAAAVLAVRPLQRLLLWNRTGARAEALGRQIARWRPDLRVEVVTDLRAAAPLADVITLVTGATQPLLGRGDVRDGCHINAMGSYQPGRREVATDLVAAARVFADTVAGCLDEAGDLIQPIAEGRLDPGSVLPLAAAGPGDRTRLTLMKSVGSALFDLICAQWLLAQPPPPAGGDAPALWPPLP
ncbi:MAG TPA: ornithine cyclodeaminase family protein [Candidatus Dormibacteraeota bacterium]|nr:ornithine cyclodeaminase family protein [Candidatus Dormibacteraeota bacterium]